MFSKKYPVKPKDVPKPTKIYKIVIIGEPSSGKTRLFQQLSKPDPFFQSHKIYETGINQANIDKKFHDRLIRRTVWDLSVPRKERQFTRSYIADANAAIVTFDLSKPGSLKEAGAWVTHFKKIEPRKRIILVGTKSDCQIQLTSFRYLNNSYINHEIEDFKRQHNIATYIETSAVTGRNCSVLLPKITVEILLQELEERTRNKLMSKLNHYIKRIKKYSDEEGTINFATGFWTFKSSQAANRKANFHLAEYLYEQLAETDLSINEIFKDLLETRNRIIKEKGIVGHCNRGINSRELLDIISLGKAPPKTGNNFETHALLTSVLVERELRRKSRI